MQNMGLVCRRSAHEGIPPGYWAFANVFYIALTTLELLTKVCTIGTDREHYTVI